MYLKSIEVHGFKSFANKINFQFHNGITGIVGPNGSGKSNVADAVRWVLGEQKVKQLRGASMQDVIFAGTELRKPLGYAYVAITLDNSDHHLSIDYEEVTVARRIYRSGESEYMINGSLCRLKDVHELFYDTGIGKEGYSIIGQGQIDKILSGKPEERRELFDEAAGIVKFKRRKSAAQKKLEDEKQNLLRVNDILSELEKQTGPLEKQAETARIFLKKREELRILDVNMFLLENRSLRNRLEEMQEKQETADADLKQASARYEEIKERYEQIQLEVETLDRRMEEVRENLSEKALFQGRLEGDINVLKEQVNSARGSEEHLLSRQEDLNQEWKEKTKEKGELLRRKVEIEQQLADSRQRRGAAREQLAQVQTRIQSLTEQMEAGKNSIIEALNDRAGIKSRLGSFHTMTEQINIRKAELTSRLLCAKSDEVKQEEQLKQLRAEFEKVSRSILEWNDAQTVLEEQLGQIHDELGEKDRSLRDLQVSYHQVKSKLDTITNLTERYEGYGGSVKRVMECRKEEAGIIGVVADIIQVEKKYETAIETALGGSIQNIVTEDEATAKRMIEFLKHNRAGRATFLPLTSITGSQPFRQIQVLDEEGVIGLADTLVQVEPRFQKVAGSMLGRILVVDHMDHAVKIARKYQYSIRMVTLEGELLVPGGAISGGAFKNSSNLLGRRRELEALKEQSAAYLSQIDGILDEIEEIKKKRTQLRRTLEDTKGHLQDAFIEQNTARMNVIAAEEKKQEAETGLETLKKEEQELELRIREVQERRAGIEKELEESYQQEQDTQERLQNFQKELDEWKEAEGIRYREAAEQELETEKLQQQQEFHLSNMMRIEGELERCHKELEAVQEGLRNNQKEVEERKQKIEELKKDLEDSDLTRSEAEKQLQDDIKQKEALVVTQKGFFQERESLSGQITGLDKEVYRLHMQKEKLEEALEAQINYMWNEYEITLSDALSLQQNEMQDLERIKKEAAELKDEIRKLGDVNVNAIRDYREVMDRYLFLKGQHDDLVEAEKALLHIIDELDTAMRRQFREKFAEIAAEFDKVFKEMFGGGKGTLELMEAEDLLEAGICIVAQPPGKKLQNMMQLSGGEKALTAIALLFAIQNLKPSPFCLLDEIEAALDESNVSRFAKYLHKLTKNTQFIVITHRRGTMEKADRLYGITMQEKGVSTLVSVNLIDSELE